MAIISVLHVEDHGDPEEGGRQGDEEEECHSDEVDHLEAPWVEVREGAQTVDFGSFQRTQHWRSGRGDSVSLQPWFSTGLGEVQAEKRKLKVMMARMKIAVDWMWSSCFILFPP
jgi:hypothetical protein